MIAVKYDFIDSKTDRQAMEFIFDEKKFVNAFGFDYQKYIAVKDGVEIFDKDSLYEFGLEFINRDVRLYKLFKTTDFISISMKYDLETNRSLELYVANDTIHSVIAKVTIYLVGTKKGGNDEQTIELVKLIRDMMAYFIQRHKEDTKALDVFVDRCSKIVGAKKGGDDGKSIDVKKEK